MQDDVHRDEVVDVLLIQLVGVPIANLDPFVEAGFSDGLPGQLQARGIELQSDNLGVREAFCVVRDVLATAGADVEHLTAPSQPRERLRGLGQDVLCEHDAVGLRRVLQRLDKEGVVIASRPYPARAQVLGESSVVLVKGGVKLDATAQELRVCGIQKQRLQMRRNPVARLFVPIKQLKGVSPSAPDLDVAQLVVESSCQSRFGDALLAGVGDGAKQPRFQTNVCDPRRLIAQDLAE